MSKDQEKDNRFGSIAVELNYTDPDKVDKALVVQARILERTGVRTPIGEILVQMGAITAAERDDIIKTQQELFDKEEAAAKPKAPKKKRKSLRSAKGKDDPLEISVSKDKLTATIFFHGEVPAEDIDVNDVKIRLNAEGILHGIADDDRIKAFLNGELNAGDEWTIATGTEPVPDSPPEIIYHFDTDPLRIGTLTEDGLMDWKDRGELPQVKDGELLAKKIPGPKGKEGMDIFGKKIPIPKARDTRIKCGKGARRSEDGLQIHSTLAGIPTLSITDEISIMPTLHIDGDISLKTGHVTFDGHIEVTGAVEKGYRVKGGSLRANEIKDAEIDVEGDITAMNGIFGATIRCGGNLRAGHIHNTDIILAGDIAVEKEVIESSIEANGRCLINDGIVISSTISAKMGITAMDVGTRASHPIELTVGIDQQIERDIETTKEQCQAIKTERENLPRLIQDLKKRSDRINTRLGEVAQEQDRCMVRHRRLQEKVEAGLLKNVGPTAEKLKNSITELKAKRDAYDQDVAQLMDEDESISQQIAAAETTLVESAETILELNERLDELNERKKTDLGIATVKIGGNIYSGTRITGPNSTMILREDLTRLTLAETDSPDHDGVKRWRFELNPFR